jgi:hypothetical protein
MPDMRGHAPASERQKAIARNTITITQPWLKSTGPKTKTGKLRSSGKIHRWVVRDEFPATGLPTDEFFQKHLKHLLQMNALLRRHGRKPVGLSTEATYTGPKLTRGLVGIGTFTIVVKLRCAAADVALLRQHCPGRFCPPPLPEALPRLAESSPATLAENVAVAKVETLAAAI